MLKCPAICYKKLQNLHPRLTALIIDSSLVNFCKTIFVTLACFFCLSCFSGILIRAHNLFSYLVATAFTLNLRFLTLVFFA